VVTEQVAQVHVVVVEVEVQVAQSVAEEIVVLQGLHFPTPELPVESRTYPLLQEVTLPVVASRLAFVMVLVSVAMAQLVVVKVA